jgi:GntR family transcriptional regulator of arabinose operon
LANNQKKKYELIQEYILDSIYGGVFQPNQMIMSESDFCRIFNVSRIVVRRALDELVAKGMLYRIQGKGTFVEKNYSSALERGERRKVGIIIPRMSPFIENITHAICSEFSKQSYFYKIEQVGNNQEAEIQALKNFHNDGVSGIILFSTYAEESNKKLSDYININLPIVFIDRFIEGWPFDAVVGMDFEAGKEAVIHLNEVHGVTKIGFFSSEIYRLSSVEKRCEGVVDGIRQLGLPYNEEVLLSVNPYLYLEGGVESQNDEDVSLSLEKFIDSPHFDCEAVIMNNDITAVNFLNVCARRNIRIPEDLKVISFMNDVYANLISPSLTTFDQNVNKLGSTAANQLIKRIDGDASPPEHIYIPYKLVKRCSCGCKCEW